MIGCCLSCPNVIDLNTADFCSLDCNKTHDAAERERWIASRVGDDNDPEALARDERRCIRENK